MAKTQWHPAFCAAMRLELKENKSLRFTNEFNLTEKPLEVDMLIINKLSGVEIDNGIQRLLISSQRTKQGIWGQQLMV